MTKRTKRCLLCHKTFRNRTRLRDHLLQEHDVLPYRQPRKVKPKKVSKPLRRVRMMVNAAMRKKADDLLAMARLIRKNQPPASADAKVLQAATNNWRRIKRERKRAMNTARKKRLQVADIPVPLYKKDFVGGQQ